MSVTIHPLSCGTLTATYATFEQGGSDDELTMPVPSWLIRHPHGDVVFDTGMHGDLAGPSDKLDTVSLFFGVGCTTDDLVGHRLGEVEVDPTSSLTCVLSHLHFDHAGGLAQLPNARVLVDEVEWHHGSDADRAAAAAYDQSEFMLGHDVTTMVGEHDIFGDGLVTVLPTPGHTPGHRSLRVRLADREVVLAADCCYFDRTIDGGPLPGGAFDHELQDASRKALAAMRAAGSLVIAGHDPDVFDALPAVLA